MQRFNLLILFFLLIQGTTWAQSQEEPISAERPGFTNGTDTVPIGKIQFETGYLRSYQSGDRENKLGDGTQLRIPVSANLEARLGLPAYFWERGSTQTEGVGDANLSVKYHFRDASRKQNALPALAVIGSVELPTGKRDFRVDDYQPSLALEADWSFTERYSLTADGVYNAIRQNDARYTEWAGGLCFNIALSPTWGTFAEVYRISDTGAGDVHQNFFDTGILYKIGSNTALDINGGFGIFGTENTSFIGGGIARRW